MVAINGTVSAIGILCGKDLPNAMTAAEANDLA